MAAYLSEKQMRIWQFSSERSLEDNVAIALAKMASFRQASVSEDTLNLYCLALEGEDMRAFQVAMAQLAESERREGESAFPSLGMILGCMDEAAEVFPKELGGRIDRTPQFAPSFTPTRKSLA